MSPINTETRPVCRGSIALLSGCGHCPKCLAELSRERSRLGAVPAYDAAQKNDGRDYEFRPAVTVSHADKLDAASVLLSQVTRTAQADRRERIATAFMAAQISRSGAFGAVALMDEVFSAADRFIAELDRKGGE